MLQQNITELKFSTFEKVLYEYFLIWKFFQTIFYSTGFSFVYVIINTLKYWLVKTLFLTNKNKRIGEQRTRYCPITGL